MPPRNGNTPPGSSKGPRRPPAPAIPGGWLWLLILAGILLVLFVSFGTGGSETQIEPGVFKEQLLVHKNVKSVVIGSGEVLGEFHSETPLPDDLKKRAEKTKLKFSFQVPSSGDPELIKQLDAQIAEQLPDDKGLKTYSYKKESVPWLGPMLLYVVLPMLMIMAFFIFFLLPRMRDPLGGGFLSSYVKSPAKRYEKNKGRVTFDDVAGMENAKRELQEVVAFLRSPEKFHKLGGQIPKGILLVGPPGTGKTLIARAVAGEAGVPFFSISGSEFIQMFVGVGASRVRDLFKTARESSPCILFIDEIDAVGRVRGAGLGGGHDEREQTLNQILSEMDGFLPTEAVIVIAATNRPDVLDPALLRPGRFDRHVTIDRPTWRGRLAILKVHTRDKPLAPDVDLEKIARGMIGMTGADLRNLANEAALIATRQNKSRIEAKDFDAAADRVLIGAKREEVLTPQEKRRTAYHEAGHALCAWLEPKADPVYKVTIVPRGRALGVTMMRPEEDKLDHTQSQLMAQLVYAMGGRAADQLVFNERTAGAAQDLKQATRIARLMVTQFGMSEKIGPVAYRAGEEHVFLGKEIQEARDFSDLTAHMIDEEVRIILQTAEQRAMRLLEQNRDKLDLLAEALLQREELSKEEIDELLQKGRLESAAPSVNGESEASSAASASSSAPLLSAD